MAAAGSGSGMPTAKIEPLYLNPEYLSDFRQANAICWFQATIVALFMSPALREYIWCKVFSFTEKTVQGERVLLPISVKHSSVSVEQFNAKIAEFIHFRYANGTSVQVNENELQDIKYHIFILLEMLRRRLVKLLNHQVTGDIKFYDKESMMKEETINAIFHHVPVFSRLGMLARQQGGVSKSFISILLALYDHAQCVYIEDQNTGFDGVFYEKNNFATIIFKNNGNGVLGHNITIFTDKENRVTYRYDNDREDYIHVKSKAIELKQDDDDDVDLENYDIGNIDDILHLIESNPHSQVLSLRDDDECVCDNTINLFGTPINMSVPMIMFANAPNKFTSAQLKILFPEDFVGVGGKRRKKRKRTHKKKVTKKRNKTPSRRVRGKKSIKRGKRKHSVRKTN